MAKTKVIFRKWKEDHSVIALFPELAGDMSPYTCSSYMRVGQHSAADPQLVIAQTEPATPLEYKDLQEELFRRGYELEIIHRHRYSFIETRRKQLKQ